MTRAAAGLLAFVVCLWAAPAAAQHVHSELVVAGLDHPVAFVQDPSQSNVRFVVQQRGRIRPVVNGTLQNADFLDLSDIVSTNHEGGVLGMAFAPDYASSGRFYVNFTDQSDNTVIARFTRSTDDSLKANPDSRFDLVWSSGNAFIPMPYCCHYGGHLAFGPDGYLYIGLGDGGGWDDPDNNAQNPQTLLGKMLRIDVSVPDGDGRGYRVPGDNPFVNAEGVLPEIWSVGLRNPWRYSFDSPARGGTGGLIIGDVGQYAWEEFDYEPPGAGGRNYGWRNREGAHDYVQTLLPWSQPLVDPTYEYGHDGGRSIIGGYVYRGWALGSQFAGRYFFGDFVSGQLWSIGLNIDAATGEASAGDIWEHTGEVSAQALNLFAAFGEDADGELYVISWFNGAIYRLAAGAPTPVTPSNDAMMALELPADGPIDQPFVAVGWALDRMASSDSGIDYVEVWARRLDGSNSARSLGRATRTTRDDIAGVFGSQFLQSGFTLTVRGLVPGPYEIVAYAHSPVTQRFEAQRSVIVDIRPSVRANIDQPIDDASVKHHFVVTGWAIDGSAAVGTEIGRAHV